MEDGAPQPQLWVREHGQGRVFASIVGHFTWTFDDPLYRILLLRGMAWSARQPLDRFAELVTVGARIQD
jgi:type 1 glutamine amidotransferase